MRTMAVPASYEDSLSNKGYRVQEDQVRRIQKRFSGFSTLRCLDLQGRPVDPCKRGSDGGLDLILKISAKSPAAEKRIENLALKILLSNDY